jgi:hypothetical protein
LSCSAVSQATRHAIKSAEALHGHDFEAALKVLASVGALPPANAKGEYAKTVRISGVKPSRVYEINPETRRRAELRGFL